MSIGQGIFPRNLQQDPQNGPRNLSISKISIATLWTGSVGIRSHSIFDGDISLTKSCQDMFQPFQPPNQGTPSPEVPRSSRLWPRGFFRFGGAGFFDPKKPLGSKKGWIPGSWGKIEDLPYLHENGWPVGKENHLPTIHLHDLGVQKPLILQGVSFLVGGWTNPFEKYARQNGNRFPSFRDEHKNIFENHHLGFYLSTL